MLESHFIKRYCIFPGCGKPHKAKLLCHGHWQQLRSGKTLSPLLTQRKRGSSPIIEYREVPCLVDGLIGPCHEWIRGKFNTGYGSVNFNGRTVYLHRYVWELANGPIPDGMFIDHQCRNRACCNVNHLRVVTRKVNNTENVVGTGWQIMAAKTHCPKGHSYDEENTKITAKGSRKCRECGRICNRNRKRRQ